METKMGVPDGAEIAFRRKIAYFCCMRKTFVILLAVAAVCGCRQGYKMECGQSFELATPWVLNHDGPGCWGRTSPPPWAQAAKIMAMNMTHWCFICIKIVFFSSYQSS